MITAVVLIVLGIALFAVAYIASGADLSILSGESSVTNTYTVKGDFDRMEIDTEIDLLLSSRKYEQKIMEGVPFFIIFYLGISTEGFFDVLYHNAAGAVFMTICLAAYLLAILLSDRIMAIEL